jgi:hypothetical protein
MGDALGIGIRVGAFQVIAFFATALAVFPAPPPAPLVTIPHPEENMTATIPAVMVIPAPLRMRS